VRQAGADAVLNTADTTDARLLAQRIADLLGQPIPDPGCRADDRPPPAADNGSTSGTAFCYN
jgi:hypothetical protein